MSLEKEVYSKFTKPSLSHINIGTGEDISIKQLVKKLTKISGFKGEIIYNTNKPDGTIKKALDVSKIESLGWKHNISLDEGLEETFKWYSNNYPQVRK
jgi:GDP-L-fucose synthase